MKEMLEVRVGIEPTNKGFAELLTDPGNRHTVHKTAFLDPRFSGFLPVASAEGVQTITPEYIRDYARKCGETSTQVYFMADQDGTIKIGYSVHPARRRCQIQSDFLSQCGKTKSKIVLLGTAPGGLETERMLHRHFASTRRPFCEWFDLSEPLLALICELQEQSAGGAA